MIVTQLALLQNLRCNVVGCATQRRSSDGVHVFASDKQCSQAEITNFGIHMRVEEDVAHLQITMNNAFSMHVLDGTSDLDGVEARFGFGQTLSSFNHVHQRTVGAKLEDKIGAIGEGKGAVKLDDVLVSHLGMDLKFCLKLIHASVDPTPSAEQICSYLLLHLWGHLALDDLESMALVGRLLEAFIANSKTSFAKKFSNFV